MLLVALPVLFFARPFPALQPERSLPNALVTAYPSCAEFHRGSPSPLGFGSASLAGFLPTVILFAQISYLNLLNWIIPEILPF
jgi:hypothetical protein